MMPDLSPLWLSLRVASAAMAIVFPIGTGLAWWISHGRPFRGKTLIETAIMLPLVLPPTVVGFALLLALGRGTEFGKWLNDVVGIRLLFTWPGAALAAAVMSLPLFVRTVEAAFSSVDRDLLEAAKTLGASGGPILTHVIVPLSYRGIVAGTSLGFARALGEFGATMMVAGSIPGLTRTLPIALYQSVEAGKDGDAVSYTLILTVITLVFVTFVGFFRREVSRPSL